MAMEESIIRIPPYHYIHVLDQNSNVSRVEVGPKTYIRQDNERWVASTGPWGHLGPRRAWESGWHDRPSPSHSRARLALVQVTGSCLSLSLPSSGLGTGSESSHCCSPSNRILFTPVRMVTIPPRHYCMVANPVARDAQGTVLFDVTGQVRLRHADLEIRLAQDPFPLFPGEVLEKVLRSPSPYPLSVLPP